MQNIKYKDKYLKYSQKVKILRGGGECTNSLFVNIIKGIISGNKLKVITYETMHKTLQNMLNKLNEEDYENNYINIHMIGGFFSSPETKKKTMDSILKYIEENPTVTKEILENAFKSHSSINAINDIIKFNKNFLINEEKEKIIYGLISNICFKIHEIEMYISGTCLKNIGNIRWEPLNKDFCGSASNQIIFNNQNELVITFSKDASGVIYIPISTNVSDENFIIQHYHITIPNKPEFKHITLSKNKDQRFNFHYGNKNIYQTTRDKLTIIENKELIYTIYLMNHFNNNDSRLNFPYTLNLSEKEKYVYCTNFAGNITTIRQFILSQNDKKLSEELSKYINPIMDQRSQQ
jgi:hypothetical protein